MSSTNKAQSQFCFSPPTRVTAHGAPPRAACFEMLGALVGTGAPRSASGGVATVDGTFFGVGAGAGAGAGSVEAQTETSSIIQSWPRALPWKLMVLVPVGTGVK